MHAIVASQVQYNPSSRATEFSWPAAITTCTWLTRLVVERFTDLPSSIGHLVCLLFSIFMQIVL